MRYWKNLVYILQHKWYVLVECWKEGLYWQGLMHDLSKFAPMEFVAYANRFYHEKDLSPEQVLHDEEAFQYAWLHHQHHSKHHWSYWVVSPANHEAVRMPTQTASHAIGDRWIVKTAWDVFVRTVICPTMFTTASSEKTAPAAIPPSRSAT